MADVGEVCVFGDLDMPGLGQRIRTAREAYGLTQEQAAWRANIRTATLCELERGRRSGLRVHALYSLCQVLGVSADWVLGLHRNRTDQPDCTAEEGTR